MAWIFIPAGCSCKIATTGCTVEMTCGEWACQCYPGAPGYAPTPTPTESPTRSPNASRARTGTRIADRSPRGAGDLGGDRFLGRRAGVARAARARWGRPRARSVRTFCVHRVTSRATRDDEVRSQPSTRRLRRARECRYSNDRVLATPRYTKPLLCLPANRWRAATCTTALCSAVTHSPTYPTQPSVNQRRSKAPDHQPSPHHGGSWSARGHASFCHELNESRRALGTTTHRLLRY